nr:hypothetical protein [Saccharopolyspora spinosa]
MAKASPWAMTAAYNSVNGRTMTENSALVNDVLKGEWAWGGMPYRTGLPPARWSRRRSAFSTWPCPDRKARGATGNSRRPWRGARSRKKFSTTRSCGCCGWPIG